MAIPESQLRTWSAQGAIKTSASTRDAIYSALSYGLPSQLADRYEVYLQGSYRNDTNVFGESDVDIVVQFNGTYVYDLSSLPAYTATQLKQGVYSATYHWADFRRDVHAALRSAFGDANVTEGSKCIKVAGNGSNRRAADVVVALQHRSYQVDPMTLTPQYIEGIVFYSRPYGGEIVNYPKQHYYNGVAKMVATYDRFKPTVRVFKNMRNRMIDDGYITADLAPSYFLQCLLFNAPNYLFGVHHSDTVPVIINWLINLEGGSLTTLRCQNDLQWLFGETEEQWDAIKAVRFMSHAARFWNDWT